MLDVGVPGFLCLVFNRHDVQGWLVVSSWFVKRVDLTRRTAQRFVRLLCYYGRYTKSHAARGNISGT